MMPAATAGRKQGCLNRLSGASGMAVLTRVHADLRRRRTLSADVHGNYRSMRGGGPRNEPQGQQYGERTRPAMERRKTSSALKHRTQWRRLEAALRSAGRQGSRTHKCGCWTSLPSIGPLSAPQPMSMDSPQTHVPGSCARKGSPLCFLFLVSGATPVPADASSDASWQHLRQEAPSSARA